MGDPSELVVHLIPEPIPGRSVTVLVPAEESGYVCGRLHRHRRSRGRRSHGQGWERPSSSNRSARRIDLACSFAPHAAHPGSWAQPRPEAFARSLWGKSPVAKHMNDRRNALGGRPPDVRDDVCVVRIRRQRHGMSQALGVYVPLGGTEGSPGPQIPLHLHEILKRTAQKVRPICSLTECRVAWESEAGRRMCRDAALGTPYVVHIRTLASIRAALQECNTFRHKSMRLRMRMKLSA